MSSSFFVGDIVKLKTSSVFIYEVVGVQGDTIDIKVIKGLSIPKIYKRRFSSNYVLV